MEENDFFSWTIRAIRDDASQPIWLEDRKTEWVPLAESVISCILDGYTVIMMSDEERAWFVDYAIGVINRPNPRVDRPFLPIYSITQLSRLNTLFSSDKVPYIQDMLSISFGEKYLFWYTGKTDGVCAKLSFSHEHSFNWLLGEQRQSSFVFENHDELLDIKLLQLLRIFNKSLSAALAGEILSGD